jgi:glycine/D-amino acid oxidase-like deaminating enzyme
MPSAYDAIVIGAGVMGASIAFHLARAGLHNTLLLERKVVCAGNTRKSGALVRMHYSNEPEARLAFASLPYFQNWSELVGGSAGFQPTGFLALVGPENAERLRRNVEMQRRIGINTQVVESADLAEVQPGLNAEDGAIGAFEPDSGYCDPLQATHALVRSAIMHGVCLLEGVTVTAIRHRGGRVIGVSSSEGDLDAPLVFCAANIWSPALLRTAGVELDLYPFRSQKGYFARPDSLRERARIVLDLARDGYCRPHGDQYVIGAHWKIETEIDPDAYNEANDPDFVPFARDLLSWRVPQLAGSAYVDGDAGVYDMSPDTRAILDRAPGLDGLYLAAGFSGSGFKISPMVGRCLVELATEGRATSADLHPFRYSRYAENDPIRGEHEYSLPQNWGMKW